MKKMTKELSFCSPQPKGRTNLKNQDGKAKGKQGIKDHGKGGPAPGGFAGNADNGDKAGGVEHDKDQYCHGADPVPAGIGG